MSNEVVKTGTRRRPPKVQREAIKVRIKNKGSQSKKCGHKRKNMRHLTAQAS